MSNENTNENINKKISCFCIIKLHRRGKGGGSFYEKWEYSKMKNLKKGYVKKKVFGKTESILLSENLKEIGSYNFLQTYIMA